MAPTYVVGSRGRYPTAIVARTLQPCDIITTTRSDKSDLRAAALAARDAVSPAEAEALAARLALVGPRLACDHAARTIAAYWPIGAEVSTVPLLHALDAADLTVALPVTGRLGEPLVFRRWRPGDVMERGRMGIPVPQATAAMLAPDLLFVPLTAFDRRGHRVGYGAGFYDRTLAALRGVRPVLAIGIAHACQEVAAVPHEVHDEALDMIVTDCEIIACSAAAR